MLLCQVALVNILTQNFKISSAPSPSLDMTAFLLLSKACPHSALGSVIVDIFPALPGNVLKDYILGQEGAKCEDPVLFGFITSWILNNWCNLNKEGGWRRIPA